MIKKYGKPFDKHKINRNTITIEKMVEDCQNLIIATDILHTLENKCRICGSSELSHYITMGNKFDYYRCCNCRSLVMLELPEIRKIYDSNQTNPVNHYVDEGLFHLRVEMIANPKAEFVYNILGNSSKNRKWLDIGCGTGEILAAVANYGFDATGIEIDTREIAFGLRHGLKIKSGFIAPETMDKQTTDLIKDADVVSLFNVVEHMEEPYLVMQMIANTMKSGSYLVVEVPRTPSMADFVNLTFPNITHRHMCPPQHLQILSEKGMKILFGDEFEIIATWGFGQGYTDILNAAAIVSKTYDSDIMMQLCGISNEIQQVIDSNGLSDVMIYVATKKA